MELLDLDLVQASAVADMPIWKLAGQPHRQLADEFEATTARIAELECVLAAPETLVGTERGNRPYERSRE